MNMVIRIMTRIISTGLNSIMTYIDTYKIMDTTLLRLMLLHGGGILDGEIMGAGEPGNRDLEN